jgi:predicted esterase
MKWFVILVSVLFLQSALAQARWPDRPRGIENPGSSDYSYTLLKESFRVNGRTIDFFAPKEAREKNQKVPLIVFGHGQAIGVDGYMDSFVHIARKGVAVSFVEYDSGFFDQDWKRMGADFKTLAQKTLEKYADILDPEQVVFAGHSKGAYVALVAAGLQPVKVSSIVLFAPAGYERDLISQVSPQVPVSIIYGRSDSIIKVDLVNEIYARLPSQKKQFISVIDYKVKPDLKADHFFMLNKRYFFGGRDGITPYHYFGFWKWLLGSAWDLQQGNRQENTYLYGPEALTTGIENHSHLRK